MKLLPILSLSPLLLLLHTVLGKPTELLDLNLGAFAPVAAANNGTETKIEARAEEAEEKQTGAADFERSPFQPFVFFTFFLLFCFSY